MQISQCNAGRKNWATDIKNILFIFGFGYVWENQIVENHTAFIKEFKTRLLDCDIQKWSEAVSSMSKLRTYSLYKSEPTVEPYLLLNIPRRIRSALAKFRIGSHTLAIEVGRHNNIPAKERLCKLCSELNQYHVEDEYHLLLDLH